MRYEGKALEDYSLEEILEILKDYYLIKANDSKRYYHLAGSGSSLEIKSEFAEFLKDKNPFNDIHGANLEVMVDARNEVESKRNFPIEGDFILLKNGDFLRVSVSHNRNQFQAYIGGGSCHLDKSGFISFSGTCGDLYESKNFKLSNIEKKANFWFWHTLKGVGGGNGVYASAYFRVFKEIEELD